MKRISGLNTEFPLKVGRGDEAKYGSSGLDSREAKHPIIQPRDMYTPDLHIDTIKVKARNFRM
jgi:error-prone DNA polymerase